ncbi:MAG TPA: discoidin domain-containing protein, partial [Thermoanaerobaculia bacterium]
MAPPRLRYHLLPDPRPSGGDALNLPRGSRSVRLAILFAALLLSPLAAWCQAQALERTLDDFTAAPSGWEAAPATGVRLDLQPAVGPKGGGAVRLAFDFQGHSGYAIARRKLALDLPENYEFAFQIRGDAPIETLEFKLIDAAGDSVWWSVRRDFTFPRDWRRIAIKKRHLSFAWGPAGGGDVRRISALEIVVTAASGGRGTVDVADLTFEPLPPPHPYTLQPALTASSSAPGAEPGRALDGDPATAWHSAPGASPNQWLQVDFRERRELGGLTIDWDGGDGPRRFELLGSTDGATWQTLRAVESAAGDRAALFLPDTDVRALRIHFRAPRQGRGYGVREIGVLPVEAGASENAFFAALAKTEPRGSYPRALSGEQEFWTLVGVDGGRDQALLSEDGRLEAGLAGFSLEPFVLDGPDLIAWSDVKATQALAERSLPIPSVRWERGGLAFEVTAFASGS